LQIIFIVSHVTIFTHCIKTKAAKPFIGRLPPQQEVPVTGRRWMIVSCDSD